MPADRTVYFVVPAYDEAASIAELMQGIDDAARTRGWRHRVIVVDDGSRDRTGAIAEVSSDWCVVARHENNEGLGRALRTGLRRALEDARPRDVIVTLDADLTHDPSDAHELVSALDGGAEVAIASRYVAGARVEGVPAVRRVLSRGASLCARLFAPVQGVRDFSSGYRAYRCGVLADAFARRGDGLVSEAGFGCQLELLLALADHARFAERPLTLHYDRKRRPSAIRVAPTVAAYVRVVASAPARRRAESREDDTQGSGAEAESI